MAASEALIKAVVATAEVMGNELSTDGARVMCSDLSEYPEDKVLAALTRCRREVRGRLTLADVISRIDDGRLGADEAWALIPRSEEESVVWTPEIATAFFAAKPILDAGDDVAARMAFKQAYERALNEARTSRRPVVWSVSVGYDKSSLEATLRNAVDVGRISAQQAVKYLPNATFETLPALPSVGAQRIGGLLAEVAKVGS